MTFYGAPAELASVNLAITSTTNDYTLEVREDSNASLIGETNTKRLVLDDNGEAVLILTGDEMEAGSMESEQVTLAASFDPGQGFETLQETIAVTISPPGSLIMNVTTEPEVIQADLQTAVVLSAEISIGSSPKWVTPSISSSPSQTKVNLFSASRTRPTWSRQKPSFTRTKMGWPRSTCPLPPPTSER